MTVHLLKQPGNERLGEVILAGLSDPRYTSLHAGIAFAKRSGVRHLLGPLVAFREHGQAHITLGIDHQGTSLEAVQDLYLALGGAGCGLYLLRNPSGNPSPTFHPKLWLFEGPTSALVVVGSGNLTAGGLYTNYEAGAVIQLDLAVASDVATCGAARDQLAAWQDPARPEVVRVTDEVLRNLYRSGELPSENSIRRATRIAAAALASISGVTKLTKAVSGVFGGSPLTSAPEPAARPNLPPPPVVAPAAVTVTATHEPGTTTSEAFIPIHKRLIIMVRPQQKTELYLAKSPAVDDPAFFGFPFRGLTNPRRSGDAQPQPDPLPIVNITVLGADGSVAGEIKGHPLKMWTYSIGANANDDFRLTLPANLLALVPNDAILVIDRDPEPEIDLGLMIYPPAHAEYPTLQAACNTRLPNSTRSYGWQ